MVLDLVLCSKGKKKFYPRFEFFFFNFNIYLLKITFFYFFFLSFFSSSSLLTMCLCVYAYHSLIHSFNHSFILSFNFHILSTLLIITPLYPTHSSIVVFPLSGVHSSPSRPSSGWTTTSTSASCSTRRVLSGTPHSSTSTTSWRAD